MNIAYPMKVTNIFWVHAKQKNRLNDEKESSNTNHLQAMV